MKSPANEVKLSLEDEHVQEAIKHFNKAWDISETNVRALYDLGLIHKAAGDYEGARKFFRKVLEVNLNNQTPMDQANAREQIGLCCLAMARVEDAPLRRDRLMEMATREFQMAIEDQCQAAKNIQGMSVESTWNSFSTLKALIEDEEVSNTPASKLKELANLHGLIGSHHKAISCYEELRKLDESEWNSAETMKKMIETYSSAGRYHDSIHLVHLLWSFSPAEKRKKYSEIAVEVYLDAAQAFYKKGERMEMVGCFRKLFRFFNSPAEEREVEDDVWDVMILHDDSDDLEGDGERLETALVSMCDLRVTRNDKDLFRGQSELAIIGVMKRCKCLIFLLGHSPLSDRMEYLVDVAFALLHDNPQVDIPLTSINVVTVGKTTQAPMVLEPCPRVSCPSSVPSEGSPECLEKVLELMRTIVTEQKVRSENTAVKTVD